MDKLPKFTHQKQIKSRFHNFCTCPEDVNSCIAEDIQNPHICTCKLNSILCKAHGHECTCYISEKKCKYVICARDKCKCLMAQWIYYGHKCICFSSGTDKCISKNHSCICLLPESDKCMAENHNCICYKSSDKCMKTEGRHECICLMRDGRQCLRVTHKIRCSCDLDRSTQKYSRRPLCPIVGHQRQTTTISPVVIDDAELHKMDIDMFHYFSDSSPALNDDDDDDFGSLD